MAWVGPVLLSSQPRGGTRDESVRLCLLGESFDRGRQRASRRYPGRLDRGRLGSKYHLTRSVAGTPLAVILTGRTRQDVYSG